MKLDRLIAKHRGMGRTAALRAIATRCVSVDGEVKIDGHVEVDRFCEVMLGGETVQRAERGLYLMMHKPVGWLSATKDAQHATVMDLIQHDGKNTLHLAGRLDRATSGLLLLTNDGRWSKRLMAAEQKVPKTYHVRTHEPVPAEAAVAFERGFYFHTEDITTLPSRLEILSECEARVTLHEGRYHQVKRMFHRVGCRVLTLHRESVGGLLLPPELRPGEWREMSREEREKCVLGECRLSADASGSGQ